MLPKENEGETNCQTEIQFKKLIITCSCFFTSLLRCHQPKKSCVLVFHSWSLLLLDFVFRISSLFLFIICFFFHDSVAPSKKLYRLRQLDIFLLFCPFLHRPQINALSERKKKTLLSLLRAWNTWKACISSLLCQKEDGGKEDGQEFAQKSFNTQWFLVFWRDIIIMHTIASESELEWEREWTEEDASNTNLANFELYSFICSHLLFVLVIHFWSSAKTFMVIMMLYGQ